PLPSTILQSLLFPSNLQSCTQYRNAVFILSNPAPEFLVSRKPGRGAVRGSRCHQGAPTNMSTDLLRASPIRKVALPALCISSGCRIEALDDVNYLQLLFFGKLRVD